MTWLNMARAGRLGSAALALAGLALLSSSASAQDYERVLGGIALNTRSSTVLAKYGNPNEVVIGEVGVRTDGPPGAAQAGGGQGLGGDGGFSGGGRGGFGGSGSGGSFGRSGFGGPSGFSGGSGGYPAPGGGGIGGPTASGVSSGAPGSFSAPGGFSGARPGGFSGAPGGFSGGPTGGPPPGMGGYSGYSGGGQGGRPGGFGGRNSGDDGDGGFPGAPGGGPGYPGGYPGGSGTSFAGAGGGGASIGQFGQTISTLARQQEVTWIYNRKVNNNLVSYEFLIGPAGAVTQIRVSGYYGGNSRTKRGIALGSSYKEVVQKYGFPEEHYQVGRVLVASYRNKAHVQFQFMMDRPQSNPMSTGNKVVAITIATVE